MTGGKGSGKLTKAEIAKRIRAAGERAKKEAEDRRDRERAKTREKEFGGQKGPEPTRYGDWEKNGIVTDF